MHSLTKIAVELSDPQTLRNLSEAQPKHILYTTFKKAIDELTVADKGTAEVRNYISLKPAKPKIAENQAFLIPLSFLKQKGVKI